MASGINGWRYTTFSLIGCGCLIILMLGAVFASFTYNAFTHFLHTNSNLVLSGRTFITKVGDGDIKGAYSMLSSKWRQHDSPHAIRLYLTDWGKSQGKITRIDFNGIHFNSDENGRWAILDYIVYGSKKQSAVSVKLVRESKYWKVEACDVVWMK